MALNCHVTDLSYSSALVSWQWTIQSLQRFFIVAKCMFGNTGFSHRLENMENEGEQSCMERAWKLKNTQDVMEYYGASWNFSYFASELFGPTLMN